MNKSWAPINANLLSNRLTSKHTSRKCFFYTRVLGTITVLNIHRVIQKVIAPLAYWHDATNEDRYKTGSTFLAILNNEKNYNGNYVKNLQSLRRLVLVKYRDDVSLIPNESAWFGYEDEDGNLQKMEETSVFKENKLGLRQMLSDGRLIRLESPLEHLHLEENWFREHIIPILREQRKYA